MTVAELYERYHGIPDTDPPITFTLEEWQSIIDLVVPFDGWGEHGWGPGETEPPRLLFGHLVEIVGDEPGI